MSIQAVIALAWLLGGALAALFWHARVYSLYRLFGERWPEIERQLLQGRRQPQPLRRVSIPRPAGDLSYTWFAIQLANPWYASNFPGYVDLFSSLPEDLAARVSDVRREMKWAELFSVCWTLLLVAILFGPWFRR